MIEIPSYSFLLMHPFTYTTVTLGNEIPASSDSGSSQSTIPSLRPTCFWLDTKLFTIIPTDPDARSRANPIWRYATGSSRLWSSQSWG